jgi:hypothetical protein
VPLAQVLGGTQSRASVAFVQAPLQAPFAQVKLPHDTSAGALQWPCPSQVAAGVTVDEDEQVARAHRCPCAW